VRQRAFPFGKVAAAAPFLTLPLALYADLRLWLALVAAGVMLLLVAILSEVDRIRQLKELLACDPRPVRRASPGSVGIAPSSIARRDYPEDLFPPYVERIPEDARIQARLEQDKHAVVEGERHAGKTRTAFEAVRKRRRAKLLIPRPADKQGNPLSQLLRAPWLVHRWTSCVLFVNRLDTYVDEVSGSDIVGWLRRRPRSVVVATISREEYDKLVDVEHDGYDNTRELLGEERVVPLPADLIHETSLKQAEMFYGSGPEVRRLGAHLAGAEMVKQHYREREDREPAACVLVDAAIACARCGLTKSVTYDQLTALSRAMNPGRAFRPDEWQAGLAYCTETSEGTTAMLLPVGMADDGNPALTVNSILVDLVVRGDARQQPSGALPTTVWEVVREHVATSSADLLEIADAATACAFPGGPEALKSFARDLYEEIRRNGDLARSVQATTALAVLAVEGDRTASAETLEDAVAGPVELPANPSDAQIQRAHRHVEDIPVEEGDAFDVSLPEFRRLPFYYKTKARRDTLRFLLLFGFDVVGLVVGIALAAWFQDRALNEHESIGLDALVNTALVSAPLLGVLFAYFGLYRPDDQRARLSEIVKGTSIAALVLSLVAVTQGFQIINFVRIVLAAACGGLLAFSLRWSYDRLSRRWVRKRGLQARVLLVAPAETATALCLHLTEICPRPMQFVGYVAGTQSQDRAQLGTLADLEAILSDFYVDRVIFADPTIPPGTRSDLAVRCHSKGVAVEMLPSDDELLQAASPAVSNLIVPLVNIPPLYLSRFNSDVKRIIDVALVIPFGLIGGVVALPFFLALMVLGRTWRPIDWDSMPGRKMEGFVMHRMRTPPDDARGLVGLIGRFIRRLRIDELPQFVNVLRGDMALVGPRPLSLEEFKGLNAAQRRRYAVKPGITGLWQIARRESQTTEDMITLDLLYCRRWSPLLDFTILLRTFPAVLARHP
jgi:lipopolysaccharide/colanic/teichoic acid biosynthesis glycosyltransferase